MPIAPVNTQTVTSNLAESRRRNVIRDISSCNIGHSQSRRCKDWLSIADGTPKLLAQELVWIQARMIIIPDDLYLFVANSD